MIRARDHITSVTLPLLQLQHQTWLIPDLAPRHIAPTRFPKRSLRPTLRITKREKRARAAALESPGTAAPSNRLPGDHSVVEPPDPIPNSEVKRNRADGSVAQAMQE